MEGLKKIVSICFVFMLGLSFSLSCALADIIGPIPIALDNTTTENITTNVSISDNITINQGGNTTTNVSDNITVNLIGNVSRNQSNPVPDPYRLNLSPDVYLIGGGIVVGIIALIAWLVLRKIRFTNE